MISSDNMEQIRLHEHETYCGDLGGNLVTELKLHHVTLAGTPEDYMGAPHHLALDESLTASYYIGANWLIQNKISLIVLPKISNIDYLEMFSVALSVGSKHESDYFSKCYGIDFNTPQIEVNEDISQLTPLLVVHYIILLEKIIKTGLRKDYLNVTENLKNKIKGHLVLSQQIKRNIIPKREDRNVCSYQKYTCDIPINRLLKKALIFAQKMIQNLLPRNARTSNLNMRINRIMSSFAEVSDIIEVSEVKNIGANKIYKNYTQALFVAKDILRRYDYSLSNIDAKNHLTPSFWIDMSRLFELYVYSKLNEAYPGNILFQVEGYRHTVVDYLHIGEHIIIDAKYKPRYDYSYSGIIPDIREISGYSRDIKILKHFGKNVINSNEEVKCLIIYPQNAFQKESDNNDNKQDQSELEELKQMNELANNVTGLSLWEQGTEMRYFRNFRKLKVSLPILHN